MLKTLLITIVVGIASAVLTDLQSFLKARSADPTAKFDYVLVSTRALYGAITGLLLGLGGSAVTAK